MKTKNEIIQELYDTDFVQRYSMQLLNSADVPNYDDYLGELWLIICEIPEERLQKLYYHKKKDGTIEGINGVRRFVSGIITRQIKSDTSLLYCRYKKKQQYNTNIDDVRDLDKAYNDFMIITNNKTSFDED